VQLMKRRPSIALGTGARPVVPRLDSGLREGAAVSMDGGGGRRAARPTGDGMVASERAAHDGMVASERAAGEAVDRDANTVGGEAHLFVRQVHLLDFCCTLFFPLPYSA
jgi:hypothetical protein